MRRTNMVLEPEEVRALYAKGPKAVEAFMRCGGFIPLVRAMAMLDAKGAEYGKGIVIGVEGIGCTLTDEHSDWLVAQLAPVVRNHIDPFKRYVEERAPGEPTIRVCRVLAAACMPPGRDPVLKPGFQLAGGMDGALAPLADAFAQELSEALLPAVARVVIAQLAGKDPADVADMTVVFERDGQ